ncbi:hypothetical protein DPMN_097673 [Dreissena polymorpha]|uniref:Uncharacterized protein n=1 Tax=Dreissena polymorpha TaxID=45954 RepID=A0A9D4LAP0_DREPO|nr:hypothetical protein DPMN_097673 [Dreissena polymorpha]
MLSKILLVSLVLFVFYFWSAGGVTIQPTTLPTTTSTSTSTAAPPPPPPQSGVIVRSPQTSRDSTITLLVLQVILVFVFGALPL